MGYSMSQSFISSQPPLIVFTICLTAFGLTMVVLAYVVGEQEVPNPDVKMDWNKFFHKMADLNLCPIKNSTRHPNDGYNSGAALHPDSSLNSSALHLVDETKSMSAALSNVVDSALDGASPEPTFVAMSVTVKFGLQGKLPSNSHFTLKGRLKGKLLGLPGKYSQMLFNISLSFQSLENSSCVENKCSSLFEVCISMSFPTDLLPKMKGPDVCRIKKVPAREILPVIFSEFPVSDSKDSSMTCVELYYTSDAKLTEMLSPHDRSIVNLHLMHTSYFMFVMVMTLVCYSLIRGKYRQPRNYVSLQKVPLDA